MNDLLSILWAEKSTTQLGGFGLTCNILHFWIAHEAQVPWAGCSTGVMLGPIRRKWPWTPECKWSQPMCWLPAKRVQPWAEVLSLCQLLWYFHGTVPKMPAPCRAVSGPAGLPTSQPLMVPEPDCFHGWETLSPPPSRSHRGQMEKCWLAY